MKDLETKHKLIELRAKGYSYDKIAQELGTSKVSLIDWSKDLEEEIGQAKAIQLEALYEEFYLLKEARIRTLGGILKKLTTELDNRDLTEVPTDKLLDAFIKYYALLKEEFIEPIFLGSNGIARVKSEKAVLNLGAGSN